MVKEYSVYALTENDQWRYIGITSQSLQRRFSQHVSDIKRNVIDIIERKDYNWRYMNIVGIRYKTIHLKIHPCTRIQCRHGLKAYAGDAPLVGYRDE